MLTPPTRPGYDPDPQSRFGGMATDGQSELIDLDQLWSAARRQMWVVAICVAVALTVGGVYLLSAAPQFTATVKILIDPRNAKNSNQFADLSQLGLDSGAVDSQIEVIKSDKIVGSVIEGLDLLSNAKFVGLLSTPVGEVVKTIRSILTLSFLSDGSAGDAADESYSLERSAVSTLLDNLKVIRVGITYVLNVSYTSPYPGLSEDVANAFAEAYLTDQLDSKYEAARRASGWLQDRIVEARQKSVASDLAVQKFRSENGLIATDGELVSEQQLGQISTALISARAETARAEARLRRIQTILDNRETEAAVTESLDSSVINSLREKFVAASKRESELSRQLGSEHLAVVKLRSEMDEYGRLIFEELGRIAQSYESDYRVALAKEESLDASMAGLAGKVAETNETLVQLRELEQEAESYRALYESLMRRHQEAVQQQSFPITEARIITPAVRPIAPSGPRKPLVLAIFVVLGAIAGAGIGVLREYTDRGFRTARQIREELGQDCIGLLPVSHPLVDAPPVRPAEKAKDQPNALPRIEPDSIMKQVIERPGSPFAETLRAAKVSIDLSLQDCPSKIIGVISVVPGEGKSTVSKALATLIASTGNRTLLVDGDLRNPSLSRSIAPKASGGLVDALLGGRPMGEFYAFESSSRLVVLPTVTTGPVSHRDAMLSSRPMREFLEDAGNYFEYVIVDLPPLAPVADVRSVASLFHAFVLVVEWGTTPRKLVRSVLENDPYVREKCLGIILNNVEPDKLKLYGDAGAYGLYGMYTDDQHGDVSRGLLRWRA